MSAIYEIEKSERVADPADWNMLDAALAYAEQGLAVFPLHNPLPDGSCSCGKTDCSSPGKHPQTKNGLKAATTNELEIRRWYRHAPDANIGLPCGAVNDIFVLDVDGAKGESSLARLVEQYGPLPATRKVLTGKGYQFYFKYPGYKIRTAAPIDRGFPGLDSRGDGGYVVAPPSLHHTGNRRPPKTPGAAAANTDHDEFDEGSRNSTLASLAGSMRARGMTQEAIEAALLATNMQQCNPPLPDDEVRAIVRSISSYPPGSPNDVLRTLNDAGNAERFAKQWGDDARYVPELKCWLVWNGTYWQRDSVGAVMEMAKRTAFEIYQEGNHVTDTQVRDLIVRHSKLSQQAPRLKAMLEMAESIPALVVPIAKLDADPWVLGVENGTLDLRQGKLMPAKQEDYITKVGPVVFDAAAECPIFLQFLTEIMRGDKELVDYLQRLLGYMLTGDTSEQRLFFWYGTGANGKSTLLNVCKGLLGGELSRQTPAETIMARSNKSGGATPELACLKSARAVMTTEIDEGSFLSEALVKQMTGDDPIPARALFSAPIEFVPSFKLFIAGNQKPVIRGGDEGIWRRIDMTPFEVTIAKDKRDPNLATKLKAELPGILNWALAGCLAWQKRRLDPPTAVLNAVAEYKDDMDILGLWRAEYCDVGPDMVLKSGEAYESY